MSQSENPAALPDPRVLLIEDNASVAQTLQRFIERSGMRTAWAQTGARAIELKQSFAPDVVLVDLDLPDTNGVALIDWLSKSHDCGIIVVSGHAEEADRIVGLELGADDYIAKPPQLREMVARIRAVHRRAHLRAAAGIARRAAAPPETYPVQVGPWRVDLEAHTVADAEGRALALTAAEFAALQELVMARGEPVSRERLSEVALRRPWQPEDRAVDQLIFSLRRKLADGADGSRAIQSVRSAGYMLVAGRRPAAI